MLEASTTIRRRARRTFLIPIIFERFLKMPESGIGPDTSSEAVLDSDEIKQELRVLLSDIDTHSLGSFATSGALNTAINPGLTIHDLGHVGLPLSTRDALEVSRVAHQAPFGKGTETIVDTSVRKTWELNSSQFALRNPAWKNVCMI